MQIWLDLRRFRRNMLQHAVQHRIRCERSFVRTVVMVNKRSIVLSLAKYCNLSISVAVNVIKHHISKHFVDVSSAYDRTPCLC